MFVSRMDPCCNPGPFQTHWSRDGRDEEGLSEGARRRWNDMSHVGVSLKDDWFVGTVCGINKQERCHHRENRRLLADSGC